ncbi:MAG: hypothetical protein ACOYJ2_08710 [Rickettsiales bacterium]
MAKSYSVAAVKQAFHEELKVLLNGEFSHSPTTNINDFDALAKDLFKEHGVNGNVILEQQMKAILDDARFDAQTASGQGKVTKLVLYTALDNGVKKHLGFGSAVAKSAKAPRTRKMVAGFDQWEGDIPPKLDGFLSRLPAAQALGVNQDNGTFNWAFDEITRIASNQIPNADGTVAVPFNGSMVTVGYFNTHSTSTWFIKEESLAVIAPLLIKTPKPKPNQEKDAAKAEFYSLWEQIKNAAFEAGIVGGWLELTNWKDRSPSALNNISHDSFVEQINRARAKLPDASDLFDRIVAAHRTYHQLKEQDRGAA